VLDAAVRNAVLNARPDWRITTTRTGDDVIDALGKLDPRQMRVLATVVSMLIHRR
jgi:hypothetical protein